VIADQAVVIGDQAVETAAQKAVTARSDDEADPPKGGTDLRRALVREKDDRRATAIAREAVAVRVIRDPTIALVTRPGPLVHEGLVSLRRGAEA
jgi:hypothetical protein